MPDWQAKYEAFLQRFGTHFTKGITLGGLAFQRTSGLATAYLRSSESERTLESKAGVQLEAVKGGASAQAAVATASQTDQQYSLERTSLEFRGGHGSPTGINDQWVQSLVGRPAIVKANLERLSYLLTPRFFPDQEYIDQLQRLLDGAISRWIVAKGRSTGDTAPLRYGEAVALIYPWPNGKTEQILGIRAPGVPTIEFQVRNGVPFYPETMKAALRIVSSDGSNKNMVILAGDQVRIEVVDAGFLDRDMWVTKNPSGAGRFTILHDGAPDRTGEYFQSSDDIAFQAAGEPGRFVFLNTLDNPRLMAGAMSKGTTFRLRRCAERDDE